MKFSKNKKKHITIDIQSIQRRRHSFYKKNYRVLKNENTPKRIKRLLINNGCAKNQYRIEKKLYQYLKIKAFNKISHIIDEITLDQPDGLKHVTEDMIISYF